MTSRDVGRVIFSACSFTWKSGRLWLDACPSYHEPVLAGDLVLAGAGYHEDGTGKPWSMIINPQRPCSWKANNDYVFCLEHLHDDNSSSCELGPNPL